MVHLSKSKYCGLWQCPKMAWLRKYKPEAQVLDASVLSRMEAGNEVGDLAMELFGDFVEVTAYDGDNIDLGKMMENTRAEMEKGTPIICEASFEYNGLYCAVDSLKKENGGWAIYEVKSSTKHEGEPDDHQVYIADVAYQKYVLPAIFPDDPALDYHNLEGVHNGGEAMTIFPKIKDLPPEEQQTAR